MIGIYNEGRNNWEASQVNDKVHCVFTNKEIDKGGKKAKQSAHIIVYNSIFDDASQSLHQLTTKAEYCNMKDIATISDKNSTIVFSKKDYNPFVTEKSQQLKDILLITLRLRGRKVIGISNDNTFILDGFIMGGELSLIASLNNFENSLSINLLNDATGEVTVYTFGRNVEGNVLCMDVATRKAEQTELEAERIKIKKFRPSRPTHTIIVYKKDLEQLQQVVDTKNHNVVEISKLDMDKVIEELKDQKYKAVTLFVNTDEITGVTKKIYGAAMVKFNKEFKTYYELLNTKRVRKIKI